MSGTPQSSVPLSYSRFRGPFACWLLCILAGPALFAYQLHQHRLGFLWYLPLLASLGALAAIWAARAHRSAFRTLFAALCIGLAAAEWFIIAVGIRSPEYTGPLQIGSPLPPFRTQLADGRLFTDRDFASGKRTAIVFFRGRW